MAEKIEVDINGKDNLSPVVKSAVAKSTLNLKQMGADISGVGVRMSAAFTLPIVALGKMILANKDVAAALKPVSDELAKVKNDLALAFLPIIQQAMPALLNLVGMLSNAVTWFSNLDMGTKNTIVAFLAVVAAIGPVVVIVGQVITVVGTLQALLPGLATGISAIGLSADFALGPIALFIGAVLLLYKVIHDNWATIQKAAAIAVYVATGKLPDWALKIDQPQATGYHDATSADWGRADGGSVIKGHVYMVGERGPEPFIPQSNGTIIPNGAAFGGQSVINFTYAPTVGIGSEDEMEKAAYRLSQALRRHR